MADGFKIAVIATVYRPKSHADVIVSRWLSPRETDSGWGWSEPKTQIESLYVQQRPSDDMAHQVAAKFGIPVYSDVRDALQIGGNELAADAVLLIGEHGDYPLNQIGQKLYPRKELFDQVVEVFAQEGRVVPVFFDKHLSWNFNWAQAMYQDVDVLQIPFFGGSSLPHCEMLPEIHIPVDAALDQVVATYPGPIESYLFHSLEVTQALVERSANGEGGVRQVCAYRDAAVWRAMDAGLISAELVESALASLSRDAPGLFRERCTSQDAPIIAFRIEYGDGLAVTHIRTTDVLFEDRFKEFGIALRLEDIHPTQAARVVKGGPENFHGNFARLNRLVEDFFLSRRSPIPRERILITTGTVEACMHALAKPGVALATPHLEINYGAA